MDSAFKHLKKNKIICSVILLFLFVKLLTLSYYGVVWWDAAVYIGMGKYIYSLGDAGLWENSRPVVWPLILGFLWKAGFDVALAGKVADIIFGSLCILFTYLIGKKLFNKKTALLASIFLALSPTFFFFNGLMLTETASTFFSLAAIYLFVEKKHLIAGIFFGVAFMARFLQLFVLVSIIFAVLAYFNKKNLENLQKIIMGFIIAIMPFLILNQVFYSSALYPFLQQIRLSSNSGWANYHPLNYYFIELFRDNFLYLFFIIGIFLAFKDNDANKKLVAVAFIIFFVFFNSIKQKEMRFLIVLLPYMYMLVSHSITNLLDKSKNNLSKNTILALVALSLIFSIFGISTHYKDESNKISHYNIFQNNLEEYNVKGKIWISNPIVAVPSNAKIDNLMYYPVFSAEKIKELSKEAKKADFIFMDACDLACKPADANCEKGKSELLAYFRQQLKIVYSSKLGLCEQFVFQK